MSELPPPLLVTAAVITASLGGTAHASTVPPVSVPIFAPGADLPEEDHPQSGSFATGPTTPGKWPKAPSGSGTPVSYSFMDSGLGTLGGEPSVGLSSVLPTGYESEIVEAFDAWSAVADIDFMEVTDPGVAWRSTGADASDIRITGVDIDGSRGVLARAFFPPNNGGAAAGDIHFDTSENWKIGFGGSGFDVFQVAAHEIGHSIGLGHQCDCVESLMNPFYTENIRGVQTDDADGATSLYGERLVAPIPLPAALPLMGVALALLGALGLRRRGSRMAT